MDKQKIEQGVRLILEGIGEDLSRPGIKNTPKRVAELYTDLFDAVAISDETLCEQIAPIEGDFHDEMVVVKDIHFYSICEHHLLPFFGRVHIAYIPGAGRMVGLSKLARLVDSLSRKPQLQERLTTQLADMIDKSIKPKGTMVIIKGEHLCMSMRGVRKEGSRAVTSAVRGLFRTNKSTRDEMLTLCSKI